MTRVGLVRNRESSARERTRTTWAGLHTVSAEHLVSSEGLNGLLAESFGSRQTSGTYSFSEGVLVKTLLGHLVARRWVRK